MEPRSGVQEKFFRFQKMNFSELFRQSNQICKFSPDGKYLASVVEFRLVVRDVATFQVSCWVDWLQSLKQFFINVSYRILVASLTLIAIRVRLATSI